MFDGLLYAALYGFLLAFAIGPVFFTLIETSITKGFKAGLFFDLGAQTADIIFILIAYFSTSKILVLTNMCVDAASSNNLQAKLFRDRLYRKI